MTDLNSSPTQLATQLATQQLVHGSIICKTDNSNVIRLNRTSYNPACSQEHPPTIEFVGEGIAKYEIQLIYQPNSDSFPCLVSHSKYTFNVTCSSNESEYLATPISAGECNKSQEWLTEGVQTMNVLYEHHTNTQPSDFDEDKTQNGDTWSENISTFIGNILGSATRIYFQ